MPEASIRAVPDGEATPRAGRPPCPLCADYQQMIRSAKNRQEPELAKIHERVLALHQKAKHA
ncbi:hypothetical protein OHB04_22935 [Streptomyces sp. NBC_01775]|uniref:hypothetical protein n=1 Tax=Streptomyces sp. NBC_01775 TaxID=2975939 RepID=UPI002DDBE124|nr:hypothetical protein [Streptomyces sp. NBC_01775]WSB78349.1 hypothetical protein OHB04_22935 [Streptomyces sp. NBC_01775]